MNHVYLIGFMGSGKSTVGRGLARRVGMRFVDLDDLIEARGGRSIAEIFSSRGEAAFREIETTALESMTGQSRCVVACGGGVVIADENRLTLKRTGRVVYLKVDAAEALARIGDPATRPLLAGGGGVTAATSLLAAREALYTAVSDVTIDTADVDVEEVIDQIIAALDLGMAR